MSGAHAATPVHATVEELIRARLIEILTIQWSDNVKAWALEPSGAYSRVQPKPGAPLVRSQALTASPRPGRYARSWTITCVAPDARNRSHAMPGFRSTSRNAPTSAEYDDGNPPL